MNTQEVAAAFDTTPKLLRQFLRADDNYSGVGSGGSYAFAKKQLPVMWKRFDVWLKAKETKVRKPRPPRYVRGDAPGLDPSVLASRSRQTQRQLDQISRERVDRLEAALLASGKHVSQARPR